MGRTLESAEFFRRYVLAIDLRALGSFKRRGWITQHIFRRDITCAQFTARLSSGLT